jgi:hypothetical protein
MTVLVKASRKLPEQTRPASSVIGQESPVAVVSCELLSIGAKEYPLLEATTKQ